MSCQIRLAATIADVTAIRRCLFPTDDLRGSDSWLQLCEISTSPTGDIIAIANDRRLVILSAKWDAGSLLSQYQITYSGSVHESDNIKAVLCLPLVSRTKSSHVLPDWTCILLGFESGYVRFYTEQCELLLEEQLHTEIINSIKCRSQHNPRSDLAPDLHPEEIYVQYQSNVCVLSGGQLFPTLRLCRSELARVQAKGESLEPVQCTLSPKKWGFQDQATINDTAVVGVNLHGTFDHLLTASTCGGFETRYKTSGPINNLVLAAGSRPFVGFHYALEGTPVPVLSDVAKAVASKLKSALPGWLTGSKSQTEKQVTVAMQPVETMGCRFGLCDLRRTAVKIVLSADHKLAAVSDALGRVLLVDAFRGITLRIFKGYRDAQCSFVQVPDEKHSKHRLGNKVATFLVIYSPKKGTLEIFTVHQGAKIATFTASKFSTLIYNNYGLLGYATTTTKSRYVCQFTTVLIDNDGMIKEILIPFHFALSYKNNKRARDIHLYKKLKALLKYGDCDTDTMTSETCNICTELKTTELKLQTLELLLMDKNLSSDILLKCVQNFMTDLGEGDDSEQEKLRIISENCSVLLNLYQFLTKTKDSDSGDSIHTNNNNKLNLSDKELSSLQKFIDLNKVNDAAKSGDVKVGFADLNELSASHFMSVFETNRSDFIQLKTSIDDSLLFQVSETIFRKYVATVSNLDSFGQQLLVSKIATKSLFVLLIHYWVNSNLQFSNLERQMNNLLALVQMLIETVKQEELVADYSSICQFWLQIRNILALSSKPFPALIAAIICKFVYHSIEEDHVNDSCPPLEDDNMEVLSQESIEWSLLIGKLEDVSLLNIVLANTPTTEEYKLPKLKHDQVDISLKYILDRGKGSVSELVAQWLTRCGADPELILINDQLCKECQEPTQPESNDDDDITPKQDIPPHLIQIVQSEQIFDHLNMIRIQFPYSVNASMLLANMCWEYALAWQKDIQNLENLEASISCLSHIPDSHVREGLHYLVWNTHLKMMFESACKLLNKAGKLTTERLCRQDTGLSDSQIGEFFHITTDFLDAYMEAVQQSHSLAKPKLEFEQIWENGPQPLVELALQQSPINYDLLHLHYQLSFTLEMMAALSVKHTKPVNSLFESYMFGMFFQDFQTKAQINWNYADSRVSSSRTKFLCKVILASIENITSSEGRVYVAEHVKWMSKCIEIATLWNLQADEFKRYQVAYIYIHGFDNFGDEIFSTVEDRPQLGKDLLRVAGLRLSQFLKTDANLAQNVAALLPAVTRFVDSLNDVWCAPCTLNAIEHLTRRSLSCMNQTDPEYKTGELLLDGVQTLQIHQDS